MEVSKNGGTPKSSILIGFSIINHPFWPQFLETPISLYARDSYTQMMIGRYFLASLAAQLDKNNHQLPSHLLRVSTEVGWSKISIDSFRIEHSIYSFQALSEYVWQLDLYSPLHIISYHPSIRSFLFSFCNSTNCCVLPPNILFFDNSTYLFFKG